MLDALLSNLATIVVFLVVAALISLVTLKLIRDKKKGKSSCGCNCADCPSAGMCHNDAGDNTDTR